MIRLYSTHNWSGSFIAMETWEMNTFSSKNTDDFQNNSLDWVGEPLILNSLAVLWSHTDDLQHAEREWGNPSSHQSHTKGNSAGENKHTKLLMVHRTKALGVYPLFCVWDVNCILLLLLLRGSVCTFRAARLSTNDWCETPPPPLYALLL